MPKDQRPEGDAAPTLGDVLYGGKARTVEPESEWVRLVHGIAAGDQLALHALYERTHRLVFTLIVRIASNRETAEELTLDVFHDLWRRAARYDPANGTVLGWIMNQARSRAIDRLRFEQRKKRAAPLADESTEQSTEAADVGALLDALEAKQRALALRAARAALTPRSGT